MPDDSPLRSTGSTPTIAAASAGLITPMPAPPTTKPASIAS